MLKANCVIVGDGNVGKTALLERLLNGVITQFKVFEPTIVDHKILTTKYESQPCEITFVDTSGQENYAAIREANYPDAQVIAICFSIDNKTSYNNVSDVWIPDIRSANFKGSLVLIGTKSDLKNDPNLREEFELNHKRFITPEMGIALKNQFDMITYIECSAFMDINVNLIKKTIIEQCFSKEPKRNDFWNKFCCLEVLLKCFRN